MSAIKSAYKALGPEQRALIDSRQVEGERSPDEWLALLLPVAEFDRQVQAVRAGGGGWLARRFARKHDVPDGVRNFALPLLPILREDHDPDQPLELRLDLTGPTSKEKEASKSDAYKRGAYHKIVDTFYDDPWLQGRARFVDGADVRFVVTDHVRSQRKTKRNPRGKIKTKVKNKKKTSLEVAVTFPAKNYAEATGAEAGAGGKEAVKSGDARTVVRVSQVLKPGDMEAAPEVQNFIDLVARAYRRVNPARRKKL